MPAPPERRKPGQRFIPAPPPQRARAVNCASVRLRGKSAQRAALLEWLAMTGFSLISITSQNVPLARVRHIRRHAQALALAHEGAPALREPRAGIHRRAAQGVIVVPAEVQHYDAVPLPRQAQPLQIAAQLLRALDGEQRGYPALGVCGPRLPRRAAEADEPGARGALAPEERGLGLEAPVPDGEDLRAGRIGREPAQVELVRIFKKPTAVLVYGGERVAVRVEVRYGAHIVVIMGRIIGLRFVAL